MTDIHELIQKLHPSGKWEIANTCIDNPERRIIAHYSIIDNKHFHKFHGYGGSIEEALENLIKDVNPCYILKK